jgi:hypothetical protein
MPDEEIPPMLKKLHFVSMPDRATLRPGGRGSCPCERSAIRVSPSRGDQTPPRSEKIKINGIFKTHCSIPDTKVILENKQKILRVLEN